MFSQLSQPHKILSLTNFVHKMKRITKDRSVRNLTTRSSRAKTKATATETNETQINKPITSANSLEQNEPNTVKTENVSGLASRFESYKITKKPMKRPHIKIEYEENEDEPIAVKQELKEEVKTVEVKVKQEPEDSQPDLIKVIQESDLLPSPEKKHKFVLKSQAHVLEMLQNLREMRKDFDAPVDSMGCDKCHDAASNPKDKRFQVLLSLILSAMTKDQVTYAAMKKLTDYGCSVDKMLAISDEQLAELIYPVNYWKKKVQYIKEASKIIKAEYNGDIPNNVTDLCKLKGVGPKIAHLCMKSAWGIVTGIGVDTHVHRISNRMGWVQSKTPEETRKQLEALLPQDLWKEVNHLLVGFGQQVCQQAKPQCATCLNNTLCPFGISYLMKNK